MRTRLLRVSNFVTGLVLAGVMQLALQCRASAQNAPDYPSQETEQTCAQFKKEALAYVETLHEAFRERLLNEQPSQPTWVSLPNGKRNWSCYPEMELAFYYYVEAHHAAWMSIMACQDHAASNKRSHIEVPSISIDSFQDKLDEINRATFGDLFNIDTKAPPEIKSDSSQGGAGESFLKKLHTYEHTVRDGYELYANPEKFVTAFITDKGKAVAFRRDNYALTYEVYRIAYDSIKEGKDKIHKVSNPLANLVDEAALRKLVNLHSELLRAVDECCRQMASANFNDTSHWEPKNKPPAIYNNIEESRALFDSDFEAWAASLQTH